MNFRQIKIDEWVKGDYRAFAETNLKASKIEEKFGFVFENIYADGLGETKLAGFVTDFGTQFFLEEFYPNTEQSIIQIGILNNGETLAPHLDEVLEVLEITSTDLSWYDEKIKFHSHELWRQDDNGHQFLIEVFLCRANAVKAMREFEARLHKQTYWVEKV